jgi:hypothetical protein
VHRDISFGNILLSRETDCSDFFREAATQLAEKIQAPNIITFRQRPCHSRVGGLLHDLDMAAPRRERQPAIQTSEEIVRDDLEREGKDARYDGLWKAIPTVRATRLLSSSTKTILDRERHPSWR